MLLCHCQKSVHCTCVDLLLGSLFHWSMCLLLHQYHIFLIAIAIFVVVQSLSCVRLFATPRTAAIMLPCPSPYPRACSNSHPLNRWCYPTISSSVIPSPAFNLSQHQGLFRWVSFSHQVARVLEFQLQPQSFQWRTDMDGLVGSPCSLRDSQESSSTPQFKSINSSTFTLLYSPTLTLSASLVAQLVKNPPTMQETWVRSLGWEYPLEKGKATYSSILNYIH